MAKLNKAKPRAPRERGQIVRKGPRKYLVRAYVGLNSAGRKRYSAKTVNGTISQAQQALTKLQSEIDAGVYVAPVREAFKAFAVDWLELVKQQTLSPRTLTDYRRLLDKYAVPTLGAKRLDQISMTDIQRLYHTLQREQQVGVRTVRYVHAIVSQLFKHAVRSGTLRANPAQYVTIPRVERRQYQVLTVEQVYSFLRGTVEDPLHALWSVLLLGGLRPQEAFALEWSDLDCANLRINKALTRDSTNGYAVGRTKTESSRRTVQLPACTVEALHAHRQRQARRILAAGVKYSRNPKLIFANHAGKPLDISKVRRHFKAQLLALKLPDMRLYDARHTHATMLLVSNISAKIVQERLGHSSIMQTLDTYTHVLPSMGQVAVAQLDAMYELTAGAV